MTTPTTGAAELPEAQRFTKKPVTIEAIQWTGKNLRAVITFTDGPPDTRSTHAGMAWEDYAYLVARDGLKIYTLEGKMLANVGDWIIRGVKGEYYPCKPDIFEATYSPAAQVEALSAAQAGAPVIPAMMYLMLTDAMGYDSGEDGTTWSPEEWAAHLYSFYKSKTAPAQPGQEGEPVAWLSVDCIGERYLCFTRPDDDDPVRPLVFGDTAPPTHDQETPASIAVAAARKMLKEET